MEQLKLARTALKVEVLQNGLRKQAIEIIKASCALNFTRAIHLTEHYIEQLTREQRNAEEAIAITEKLLSGENQELSSAILTRKETADLLQISMDALRNWEMNGTLPYEVMPAALQKAASLLPLTQGIKMLKAASLGMPMESVILPVVIMFVLIVICVGISLRLFKWE
ncbi:ABC transporter permease [Paenibacillus stellifer]|uniref:ABC transporter permease n=1 Tax=Paenibacillus stellifer TaxID=169760 RepID=UPI001FE19DA4|nr:ABC transporter permease [Paenibacillus stellifer]